MDITHHLRKSEHLEDRIVSSNMQMGSLMEPTNNRVPRVGIHVCVRTITENPYIR